MIYENGSHTKICQLFISLGFAISLYGCAAEVINQEPDKTLPVISTVRVARSRPTGEKPAQPPATIKESTLEQKPFELLDLSVHEEHGQTTFRMKFSSPANQYRHFALTEPSRVILDIFGETKGPARSETFHVDTHWVSVLKFSSSEGYLRMAAEVPAATIPAYVVEPENGGLRVTIGPMDPQATAKKDLLLVQGGKGAEAKVAEAKPVAREGAPATSTAQAPPLEEKKYTGQRISLDFKDADIKNVLRLLAEVSGLNIVVTDDVTRRVTLRLVDVPWDQALDLLIQTNGLAKEQVGNVLRISTAGRLKVEKDALIAARKAEEKLEPLQTAYLSVNYAKVKELVEKVKPVLSGRGLIISDDRSNTIIVRDIKQGIDEAATIVSRLDTRTPQVLIESNLIETTPTFSRSLGFTFQFNSGGTIFTGAAGAESPFTSGLSGLGLTVNTIQARLGGLTDLQSFLEAAEQEGNIKIISRPSVVTLNNVESTIQSLRIVRVALPTGTTNVASGTGAAAGAAVATEQIPIGITLTVTPQVSSDGFVMMNISVKSSTLGPTSFGAAIPDELSREAVSNVLVRDGETIVIGGILKDTTEESEAGIPYLKDIPVLGWFFRRMRWQKDFEELMVFITPRIMTGGAGNLPSAEDLWREQMKKTTEGG